MPYREIIFNNFWLKITALLLAVLVWFTLHRTDRIETDFPEEWTLNPRSRTLEKLHITVMQPATDLRKFEISPKMVDIEILGDESQLKHLSARDIQASVDLGQLKSGHALPVRVHLPRGFRVERVEPAEVEVGLVKQ